MTTYRDAGVDIEAGEETVRRIRGMVQRTFSPAVLTDIGAFGGLFALDPSAYREPVLVSSVDGVGTKLKVAFRSGVYDTVGEDLVNHCVNDIAVCGARPLFFLDYFATGKLDPDVVEAVISGFVRGCEANGCALIGGETAEMPDLYHAGEFDLSGTVVGIVERSRIVDGSGISPGDVLVALPSTGLHTNGYSLARKILFAHHDIDERPPELQGRTVGEVLLDVHRSYLKPISVLHDANQALGFAHITGGGIEGNTRRILPEGCHLNVDYGSWERPPIFELIQTLGGVPEDDIRTALNLGVGLVIVVAQDNVEQAITALNDIGESPFIIGSVTASPAGHS
ncbi:phosphoribosylformylglycinamidine cyclo-ligase [soil metagenome]